MLQKEKIMSRESFIIFKNWTNAINALPEENQLETYKALVEYGFSGQMPENLSPVVNAMLLCFAAGMEKNINRYNSRVENGKKGGRPKSTNQDFQEEFSPIDDETFENSIEFDEDNSQNNDGDNENLKKPKKDLTKPKKNLKKVNANFTKPKKSITDTDTVTDTVTDTETDELTFSQSINENKILSKVRACGEEAEIKTLLSENFKVFFNYWGYSSEEKACFSEIMSVLSQAIKKTKEGKLRFYQTDFSQDKLLYHISLLDEEDVHKIVWQLTNNDTINDRNSYILGACLSRANQKRVFSNKKFDL